MEANRFLRAIPNDRTASAVMRAAHEMETAESEVAGPGRRAGGRQAKESRRGRTTW
ncbi:protein of unknown function [Nitrospira japonica]|uniref:Uncharacterized protein n=1 Tax=Nitrospira japonica TaxID=1325564 RepID=A0A1W1I7C0_9BACT|nr:protein of unknown function [Nitrospira japonica]